ncbi:MAG: kynureninase [Kiloniellales bacterium]|nr:kynureninase [Kiloniellales bacterium]
MHKFNREFFAALDRDDPLAGFRGMFDLPGVTYLDGNSLGALAHSVRERIEQVVEQWGKGLIRSWMEADWINLPQHVGDKLAPLIGADPGEVVIADSTSLNLYKLAAAAIKMSERSKIVCESGDFPTDLYMLQGLERLLGGAVRLETVPRSQVLDTIDSDTALVVLTHVHYKTAEIYDMQSVTDIAHSQGAKMLWDLSHSTGAVPVDLNGAHADFAVGCSYKYLNAGPGGPAYLFVAKRLQERIVPPLSGWMGHRDPFAFSDHYESAAGIIRNLCGSPNVIGMAALDAALDLILEARIERLREKSMRLSDLFIQLLEDRCGFHGFELVSPRDRECRGSHVSFAHPDGYAIMQALIARNVIGDFRAPDVMRFGFAPVYQRYTDIWDSVAALASIMDTREWDDPAFKTKAAVT